MFLLLLICCNATTVYGWNHRKDDNKKNNNNHSHEIGHGGLDDPGEQNIFSQMENLYQTKFNRKILYAHYFACFFYPCSIYIYFFR